MFSWVWILWLRMLWTVDTCSFRTRCSVEDGNLQKPDGCSNAEDKRDRVDSPTSPSRPCTDPCSERAPGPCAPPAPRRPRSLPSDIWRRQQMKDFAQSRSDEPGWKRHLLSCWSEHTASTNASDGHSTTMKAGPGSVGVQTCSGRICTNTRSANRSQTGSQSEKRTMMTKQHLSALKGDASAVLQRRDERPDGGGTSEGRRRTNVRPPQQKERSKSGYFCWITHERINN